MTRLQMRDLRANLADTVNRVSYAGERVIILKNGKPAAAMVSVADAELIEALEDRIDLEEAKKALADPERIPYEKVRKKLGLG